MLETVQRARKIGGSLMVRVPKEIAELERIQPGEAIRLKIEKVRTDWFGAFPGLKPYSKKEDRAHSKYE